MTNSIDKGSVSDQNSSRVTSMYLHTSVPNSFLWVGTAAGHMIIFDTATGSPLMVNRRHTNAIRSIQSIRTTSNGGCVCVLVVACGSILCAYSP